MNFIILSQEKMQSGSCVVMTVLGGRIGRKKLLVTSPVEAVQGTCSVCERGFSAQA